MEKAGTGSTAAMDAMADCFENFLLGVLFGVFIGWYVVVSQTLKIGF